MILVNDMYVFPLLSRNLTFNYIGRDEDWRLMVQRFALDIEHIVKTPFPSIGVDEAQPNEIVDSGEKIKELTEQVNALVTRITPLKPNRSPPCNPN